MYRCVLQLSLRAVGYFFPEVRGGLPVGGGQSNFGFDAVRVIQLCTTVFTVLEVRPHCVFAIQVECQISIGVKIVFE
jgi:hypothetical protein